MDYIECTTFFYTKLSTDSKQPAFLTGKSFSSKQNNINWSTFRCKTCKPHFSTNNETPNFRNETFVSWWTTIFLILYGSFYQLIRCSFIKNVAYILAAIWDSRLLHWKFFSIDQLAKFSLWKLRLTFVGEKCLLWILFKIAELICWTRKSSNWTPLQLFVNVAGLVNYLLK